jgi:hypothetical protein
MSMAFMRHYTPQKHRSESATKPRRHVARSRLPVTNEQDVPYCQIDSSNSGFAKTKELQNSALRNFGC